MWPNTSPDYIQKCLTRLGVAKRISLAFEGDKAIFSWNVGKKAVRVTVDALVSLVQEFDYLYDQAEYAGNPEFNVVAETIAYWGE